MPSPHYTQTGNPRGNIFGSSKTVREEFAAIETGLEVMNSIPMVFIDWDNTGNGVSINKYFVIPFDCILTHVHIVNCDAIHATNQTLHQIVSQPGSLQVNFLQSAGTPWPNMIIPAATLAGAGVLTFQAIENNVFTAGQPLRWLSSSTDTTIGLQTMATLELQRTA